MLFIRYALLLLIYCSTIALTFAGGSLDLRDRQPLLDQQPKLWKVFQTNFDIAPTGWGTRIGAHGIFGSYTQLVGARIAPYSFEAKVKGDAGPYNLVITVEADIDFVGADGRHTDKDADVTTIKETLVKISVGPKRAL